MRLAAIAFFLVCVWGAQAQFMFSINGDNDQVRQQLSASLTDYDNANQDEWVQVEQSEYNDIENNLSDITSQGCCNTGNGSIGGSITFTNNHFYPSGDYIIAMTIRAVSGGGDLRVRKEIAPFVLTDVPQDVISVPSAIRTYWVRKQSTEKTVISGRLGVLPVGGFGVSRNSSANQELLYGFITTSIKQW